jgi:penicillin G amidase
LSIPSHRSRRLPSPWGDASISRSRHGAVRIWGPTADARAYAQGWAHAHDRPLQMTLLRIAARGQAAERLQGTESMTSQDRYLRERGFLAAAQRELSSLDSTSADRLEAYCAGINAAQARPGQPLAMTALGVDEEPWSRVDALLMLRLFAYLSLTQSQEVLERFLISSWLHGDEGDAAALARIYGQGLDRFDPAWLKGPEPLTLSPTPIHFDPLCGAAMPHFSASNAFAVAGHRSSTGHALLAGDPHLEVQSLPPTFYEVALGGPDGWAVGVSVPGLPGLLAGRFPNVAAAVTYGFMDQVDFFVEECRDGAVRRGDQWVPAQRIDEVIRVRGGESERMTVWRSDRGVIEGDPNVPGRYLCRAWSAEVGSLSRALTVHDALMQAQDLDEAFEATAAMPLSINYVLADVHGRIGLQQAGLAPDRADGHSGLAPAPAWDPTTAWRGILSPDEHHRVDATDRGWIATTNDPINPPGRTLVTAGIAGYRRERIDELLSGTRTIAPEHLRALFADVTSTRARRLMEGIAPHLPNNAHGHALKEWDHRFDRDSRGATLFERVRAAWTRDAFGPLFERARTTCDPVGDGIAVGLDPHEDFDRLWLESNPHPVHGRGWDDALLDFDHPIWRGRDAEEVLRGAIERGLNRPAVPWRRAQRFLRNWLLLDGSEFARLFAGLRLQPLIGSPETVHQGRVLRSGGRISAFAPVWRMLADLGDDSLDCCLNGGPTDQPGRTHYRAGMAAFARIELEPLLPPTGP